jgi:hypothetical protein
MTGGTALLLVYLQRAGGADLDGDEQQMYAAFAAARKAASEATSE